MREQRDRPQLSRDRALETSSISPGEDVRSDVTAAAIAPTWHSFKFSSLYPVYMGPLPLMGRLRCA